jgi:nucleoside-diphosphate-sugar epimerase
MKSPSVSITGATGFLGWHIAEAFRDRGWAVRAIVRPGSTKPLPGHVESRPAALHPAALGPAVAGSDVLVHAAALTRAGNEDVMRAVNVDGTRAAVDAANDAGARVIFISSQAAIGTGTPQHPAHEDDPPRPLDAYGRSKRDAEAIVQAHARVPSTILRPSAVYGPRDRQFLPLFRLASRGWFPLVTPPETSFTLIAAEDVARAVVMAAEDPRAIGQALFLGHPTPQTSGAILQHLARLFDRGYTPIRVPRWALRALAAAGDVAWRFGVAPLVDSARLAELRAEGFVCSVDRARGVLGFTAEAPLPDGLARTLRWYREQRWM